ncbi:MAG TPA: carboxypeptidase regulatory-like domain-containing protein [Vicinamibacterales bacterium]|nr:carboxypeptidase regulatory-like domain-containing protein [Vicinamibacterales bacterium]
MLRGVSIAALLFALISVAAPATAQTTNGVISGIISDAQGGVLPGVTVTARNAETGLMRTVVTEGDGRFRLAALPPGRYEVKAELAGFGAVDVPPMTLTTGTEITRNVTMQVQGLNESVTVTGEAPIVEVTKTEVSGVITQDQMQMLPLATRQPMDLALLMPGTSQDAVRARKANSNIGAGAFTNGSALLVDGVWNKEGNTGEPRQDFPQSAIQEFKVMLSQSPAEYGWTAGGAVSMATKSGTNQIHGEGFEFYRNKALNTIDPFVKAAGQNKPNFSRHQYGGAIGGAVVRDKIHFFEAAEALQNNLYDNVVVRRPDLYSSLNGVFKSPEYNHMSFTRGDWQIDQKQNLFVRYAWQVSDFTCEGCAASSSQPWFSPGGGIKQSRYSWAGAHTWVLSPRVLNEVRGQWTTYLFRAHVPGVEPQSKLYDESAARIAGTTQIFAFPSLGSWGANTNQYGDLLSRQIRDDVSITTGQHTWKFGAGGQSLPIRQSIRKAQGTWTFSVDQPFNPSNLAAFVPVPGSVQQFTSALLNVPLYAPNVLWDTYVEDEWKPRSGVTLNLGLRYEYQDKVFNQGRDLNDKAIFPTTGTPTSLAPLVDFSKRGDKNNFSPRVGLAWDLRNDGKTVARAGYGLYYNVMNTQLELSEIQNYRQLNAVIANPTYPDPYGGRDPISFVSAGVQNIAVQANDLQNLRSAAYTGGVSQSLTSALAIHVDGVYNKMTEVPMALDINPRSGGTTGNRPLPQFGRVLQTQSIGFADYKALLVRLEKRLARNYMYTVSYTLASTTGNVSSSSFSSTVTDAAHIEYDNGPNNSDRRHALVASGSFVLPYDVVLGTVFTARSTMPFSAIAGVDVNGDANITDYVPGTTRNVFNRGNDAEMMARVNAYRATVGMAGLPASQINTNEFYGLDVRASKSIRLSTDRRVELVAQVFNLLNRTNLLAAWTTNARSNAFGTITSAANMRQAELAVRFSF